MKSALVFALILFILVFSQDDSNSRKTWDNDAQYQGYEWMEPMSHAAHPMWDDPSLVEEVLVPRFVESRLGNYELIEEYLQPEMIEPRWVTESKVLNFTTDPDVGKYPPKKPVSPLWTPSPPTKRPPTKAVPNYHSADSAGTQRIPYGTWTGGRF